MVLFTGFPGFLGTALLPRVLAAAPGSRAICLVQSKFAGLARARAAALENAISDLPGRVEIVEGDITAPDLGLGVARERLLGETATIYHLAAVYDLAVSRELAMRVNVEGTRNVLAFAAGCRALERVHYASTCYVSGCYAGVFSESQLAEGQAFNNAYEESKYEAEVLVREEIARGMPAIIYRPAIVVGDSSTGATQKYDGPYHTIRWLLRQPRIALLPIPAGAARTELNVVPSDFVLDAIVALAAKPESIGRTFHLADPRPLMLKEMLDVLAIEAGKRVVTVPVPFRVARAALRVPWAAALAPLPLPMLAYTVHPGRYATAATTTALAGTGVACPSFSDYARRLVAFVRAHPEVASGAMV